MFRREFLSGLGVLPFFGFLKPKKENENPNNLPVVKFDGYTISNLNELLFNDDLPIIEGTSKSLLVFVKKEDALPNIEMIIYGELELSISRNYYKHLLWYVFHKTNNSEIVKCNKIYGEIENVS